MRYWFNFFTEPYEKLFTVNLSKWIQSYLKIKNNKMEFFTENNVLMLNKL